MKRGKNIGVVITLMMCGLHLQAQTAGKTIFSKPEEYLMPRENVKVVDNSQEHKTPRTWEVYADRDNTPSYTEPDLKSQPFKQLKFLETFYVIDEKDNFLHIFKKDWGAIQPGKKHKSEYEVKDGNDDHDYGWVPKDKLLLWSHSIVNEYTFSIKALPVLKNAEAFKNPDKYIKKGGTVYIYNSPEDAKPNENAVKMFQFLYVYKYENKKALIGKTPQAGGDVGNCILGWIDTSIVQIWHYSICVWPNDDDNAVMERKNNNVKASLFVNKDDAKSWSANGSPSPVWSNDPYQDKVLADVKRMPILSIDPNNVITTGNVTDVLEQNGKTIQDVKGKATLDDRQGILREHIRTINLVFVVDGSPGFRNYIPSVMKGIHDIATSRENSIDGAAYKNKIQYSAVVYRNAKDKDCPGGDMSVQAMNNFTKNWSEVSDFLDAQSKQNTCGGDVPGTQLMYAGIEKGLRKFSDQTDMQSNIVILIGGPGDNEDVAKEKSLSDLIANYKVGVVAYQLNNAISPAYKSFIPQLNRIIKLGNTQVAEKLKSANAKEAQKLNAGNWCKWNEEASGNSGDTRMFLAFPSLSPLQGAIIFPPTQKSMKVEDLSAVINKVMDSTDKIIDRNLEQFSASLNGVGNKEEIKLNPTLLMYFNALGENGGTTSKDVINKYIEGGYQFFITGFTTPAVNKLKYPVYRNVIFASAEEYQSLDETYRNLAMNEATSNELRNALYQAMYQVVVTYIGDKRAKDAVRQMNPDDLQSLIVGLRSNNKTLTKHHIVDYQDPKKVTDDEVRELAKHFDAVEAKLHKIRSDKNYTFKQEDDDYYWLPDNLLNGYNE